MYYDVVFEKNTGCCCAISMRSVCFKRSNLLVYYQCAFHQQLVDAIASMSTTQPAGELTESVFDLQHKGS